MQRGDWLLASEPRDPTDRITIEITPEVNLKTVSQCTFIMQQSRNTQVSYTLLESKMQ